MTFDAVSVENAFARLVGDPIGGRGTAHDADIFRGGNPKSLSKALIGAINAIESRAGAIRFTSKDSEPGGSKARLDVAISRLRAVAQRMSQSTTPEREDYHWEIIGGLVSVIGSLLDAAESAA